VGLECYFSNLKCHNAEEGITVDGPSVTVEKRIMISKHNVGVMIIYSWGEKASDSHILLMLHK